MSRPDGDVRATPNGRSGRAGDAGAGLAAAMAAYLTWGLLPLYWKALGALAPSEILCHRILWSAIFTGLLLGAGRRWGEVVGALRGRCRSLHVISALLIGINWMTFLWAIHAGRVLECSLGYFLNPLVNVLLGWIFLGERLRRGQWLAVTLAVLGVANELSSAGAFPWVALMLAFTFGLYGLVRKTMSAAALPGLFLEMALLGLPALAWLVWYRSAHAMAIPPLGTATQALLVGSGVVTTLPLLGFAYGVRRLRLATIGVLQYLTPTGMFLLGTLAFGEPFSPRRLITFVFIWAGVALYTTETFMFLRRSTPGRVGV